MAREQGRGRFWVLVPDPLVRVPYCLQSSGNPGRLLPSGLLSAGGRQKLVRVPEWSSTARPRGGKSDPREAGRGVLGTKE